MLCQLGLYLLPYSQKKDCGTDQHCKHFFLHCSHSLLYMVFIIDTGLMHLPVIVSRLSGLMPQHGKTDKRIPSQLPLTKTSGQFWWHLIVNEARTARWMWDHPYGITKPDGSFTDRCLNGGARDRSSVLAAKNLRRGLCPAHDRLCKWVNTRLKPIFMYSNEPPFRLVVQSQRPITKKASLGSSILLMKLICSC